MLNEEESKKRQKTFNIKEMKEKDKHFLMWSGVIFFMLLIIFFWFFNMKKIFTSLDNNSSAQVVDFGELTEKFSESVDKLTARLEELEKIEMPNDIIDEEFSRAEVSDQVLIKEINQEYNLKDETGEITTSTPTSSPIQE